MTRILIIEDELSILKLLKYDLSASGYHVDTADNGKTGLDLSLTGSYDCILIDWMLPQLSGIEIIKQIRAHQLDSILILLTAKDEEMDILEGFEAGCDDYITKPFSTRQLQARIKAHIKRAQPKNELQITLGNIMMDITRYQVLVNQQEVVLTKTEFELLRYLLSHPDYVLSREQILNEIWNFDYDGDTRIVDVHIFKLRSKLNDANWSIESVRGVGYVVKKK